MAWSFAKHCRGRALLLHVRTHARLLESRGTSRRHRACRQAGRFGLTDGIGDGEGYEHHAPHQPGEVGADGQPKPAGNVRRERSTTHGYDCGYVCGSCGDLGGLGTAARVQGFRAGQGGRAGPQNNDVLHVPKAKPGCRKGDWGVVARPAACLRAPHLQLLPA